jgi:hypothetical protein
VRGSKCTLGGGGERGQGTVSGGAKHELDIDSVES